MATIEAEFINSAIDALKDLITRPPLTEKLLSRPPFKYILDICKALSANTGFPSPDSCNYDDITDRDERTAFLTGIINQIERQLGMSVDVQIKSILAGKDVPKTLRMLVMMAQAAKMFKTGSVQQKAPENEALAKSHEDRGEEQRKKQERKEREQREQQEREKKEREQREQREHDQREKEQQERERERELEQQHRQAEQSPKSSPSKVRFADEHRHPDPEPVVERPHFNRPPPSQHSRRMAVNIKPDGAQGQATAMRHLHIVKEESSEEDENPFMKANQDSNLKIDLEGGWELDIGESLGGTGNLLGPGKDGRDSRTGHGELVADILETAEQYNIALHGENAKKPPKSIDKGDQRPSNVQAQPVQKLISQISQIIRKSIPYMKSTTLCDEHIMAMRTELNTAFEDVSKLSIELARCNNAVKQSINACNSKLYSLNDQIQSLKQTQLEMLHDTLNM